MHFCCVAHQSVSFAFSLRNSLRLEPAGWETTWKRFYGRVPSEFHEFFPLKLAYKQGGQERGAQLAAAASASPVKWSLDDVERLSRGRPSKSKLGSRAVPHRLNADERKAFELAKKKGYVIQQARDRRYPLINTHRNYCHALGFPCIRIEQGHAGSTNAVVIDLNPLHLSNGDLSILKHEVFSAVMSITSVKDQTAPSQQGEDWEIIHFSDNNGTSLQNDQVPDLNSTLEDDLENRHAVLRFQASTRNLTRLIGQTALDTWRKVSRSKESA